MAHINFYLKFLLILWCVGGVKITESYADTAFEPPSDERIRQAYERFLRLPQLENAMVSLTVLDGQTGEPIFMANENVGMAPASTLKNITAATAFQLLGSDFRFRTALSYVGTIDVKGVLHGDLIVTGSGDPSLGSDRFAGAGADIILQKWANALKKAGINKIEGRILADDLLFGGHQAPGGWPWQDIGNYYGAGVSSLNWRENAFGIRFRPGRNIGDPTTVEVVKTTVPYLEIINEVSTGGRGTGDRVYGFSAPYSNRVILRGTHGIDLKKEILLSLPDAGYHLVHELQSFLKKQGIQHQGDVATLYTLRAQGEMIENTQRKSVVLDVHESPSLKDLVYWFNQKSINLYGEALLKVMAPKLDGGGKEKPISDSQVAARLMQEYWSAETGLPASALRIVDGSGLSPENRTTTYAQSMILLSCQSTSWYGDFFKSLPTNNGMKMKSGTIGGVLGYAGYHTSNRGQPYVFAFLVSNYDGGARTMRANMFRLLDTLK